MKAKDFDQASVEELQALADRCFDAAPSLLDVPPEHLNDWAKLLLLLEAQFYLTAVARKRDDIVAKRDRKLEIWVIILIGVEIRLDSSSRQRYNGDVPLGKNSGLGTSPPAIDWHGFAGFQSMSKVSSDLLCAPPCGVAQAQDYSMLEAIQFIHNATLLLAECRALFDAFVCTFFAGYGAYEMCRRLRRRKC